MFCFLIVRRAIFQLFVVHVATKNSRYDTDRYNWIFSGKKTGILVQLILHDNYSYEQVDTPFKIGGVSLLQGRNAHRRSICFSEKKRIGVILLRQNNMFFFLVTLTFFRRQKQSLHFVPDGDEPVLLSIVQRFITPAGISIVSHDWRSCNTITRTRG